MRVRRAQMSCPHPFQAILHSANQPARWTRCKRCGLRLNHQSRSKHDASHSTKETKDAFDRFIAASMESYNVYQLRARSCRAARGKKSEVDQGVRMEWPKGPKEKAKTSVGKSSGSQHRSNEEKENVMQVDSSSDSDEDQSDDTTSGRPNKQVKGTKRAAGSVSRRSGIGEVKGMIQQLAEMQMQAHIQPMEQKGEYFGQGPDPPQ